MVVKLTPKQSFVPKEDTNNKSSKINPREIRKSYLDKMEDSLADKGVVFFDDNNLNINTKYLELPSQITEIHSRELGEYLNAFTQQKVYLRTLLGRTELMVEKARRDYYEVSSIFYKKYSEGKMSETAKERLINTQPEVMPVYYEYMDYRKKQSLVEYSIANIEDIIFMISREVSRRNGDFSEESRAYNVSRR